MGGAETARRSLAATAALVALSGCSRPGSVGVDGLGAWNEGTARRAITDFVARVTREGGSDFVPPSERIAVFDNDGTLWNEQPLYVQGLFLLDRARALSATHPDLADRPAFKAAVAGDFEGLAATGETGIAEVAMKTHTGMATDEFESIVLDWLAHATHPRFKRQFTELAYQPMIELLAYLRAHGFKTYIVSGGGIDFMRPWTERVYGIPPEQVIGSGIRTKFELVDDRPTLQRLPQVDLVDDGPGKPVGIQRAIGRRPILAFGNSDGDLQMLQYTAAGEGPRLLLLLHHDDAEREYAYDRESHVGRLDKALDEAGRRGWTVVSMRNDFASVFRSRDEE
jgi:hypothetical protein